MMNAPKHKISDPALCASLEGEHRVAGFTEGTKKLGMDAESDSAFFVQSG